MVIIVYITISKAQRDHLYNLDPNLMAQLLLFSLHLPISGQQLRQEIALVRAGVKTCQVSPRVAPARRPGGSPAPLFQASAASIPPPRRRLSTSPEVRRPARKATAGRIGPVGSSGAGAGRRYGPRLGGAPEHHRRGSGPCAAGSTGPGLCEARRRALVLG